MRFFIPKLASLPLAGVSFVLAGICLGARHAPAAKPGLSGELQLIHQRIVDMAVAAVDSPQARETLAREAAALAAAVGPDGTWPHIDYTDETRTAWSVGQHVHNLRRMALARRAGTGVALDEAWLRALDYWLTARPRSSNWWWNEIGAAHPFGEALMLWDGPLDAGPRQAAAEVLELRLIAWRPPEERSGNRWEGTNLTWHAYGRLMLGLFTGDREKITQAFEAAASVMMPTAIPGLKADYSYHLHQDMVQTGAYGAAFAREATRFIRLAQGTAYDMGPERMQHVVGFVLDGVRWVIHRGAWDWGTLNRANTRRDALRSTERLIDPVEQLVRMGAPRAAELREMRDQLLAREQDQGPRGNRAYWRSDMMVHRRPGWYASIRGASDRVFTAEVANDEALRSRLTADGANVLMVTGGEYFNVFPAWDWRRIPGITARMVEDPQELRPMRRPRDGRTADQNDAAFVGGVSDGEWGAMAMQLERQDLRFRKAWFFFSDSYLCLGEDIRSGTGEAVVTSIAQRRADGVTVVAEGAATRSFQEGTREVKGRGWVHHGGVGYVLIDGPPALVSRKVQKGRWTDINSTADRRPADLTAPPEGGIQEVDMFSLWLDHGVRPEGARYAYAVVPAVPPEVTQRWSAQPQVEILANRPGLQAAFHRGDRVLQAVFHQAGRLEGSRPAWRLEVDRPCALSLRVLPEGGFRLAVADPGQSARSVTIALRAPGARWSDGSDAAAIRLEIELPQGEFAGASVVRDLPVVFPASL